jgi:hypothetical protein
MLPHPQRATLQSLTVLAVTVDMVLLKQNLRHVISSRLSERGCGLLLSTCTVLRAQQRKKTCFLFRVWQRSRYGRQVRRSAMAVREGGAFDWGVGC